MQTQYGSDAEAAILSTERAFRARIIVDWNQNGLYDHPLSDMSSFVQSVNTDRALEGSAPEEILLVEGSSAAKITVVLGGEYDDQLLSNLFSPYNASSPFFKKPTVGVELKYSLIVDSALGQYEYPQFVGKLRTVTPDRASGTVEFTGFDRAEELRKPVLFPPFAVDDWWATTNGRRKAQELDSSWFIDHCIRQCDTSPTPWRPTYREEMGVADDGRDGTQLWVSGTGAHLPSVGWSTRTFVTQYPPVESLGIEMYSRNSVPHPDSPEPSLKPMSFNSTTSATGDHRYWCADRDQINPASLHVFTFSLLGDGTDATWWRTQSSVTLSVVYIGGDYALRIVVGNGQLWTIREKIDSVGGVVSTVTSAKVNVPSGRSLVRCSVIWDLTSQSGSTYYLSADENTLGFTSIGAGLGSGIAETSVLKGFAALYHGASYVDFCYSVRDSFGLTPAQALLNGGREATYAAVLDSGLQKLSYVPVKRGEDAWEVIKDVAASEQGSVFWDENGVFRFWNYSRILSLQDTVVRTFSLDDLSQLSVTNSTDSIRNVWSVESIKARSVYGILYNGSNADEFYVPNNTEAKIRLGLDGVVAADPSRLQKYSSSAGVSGLAQFQDTTLHGYVIEFLDGGTWAEKDASPSLNIYCRCYYDAAGNLVVRITNTTGYPIRLKSIHIGGNIVSKYDPVVTVLRDNDSVGLYGSRNYKLDGDWIQDGYSATRIRETLMSRTLNPIPTTDSITVAGDPRVQLADTVKFSDPDGFGTDLKVQVVGIGRNFSIDNGLEDTYTVQLISTDAYVPPITDPETPSTTTRVNWCPNPAAKNNASGWAGPSGYGRVTSVTSMVRTTGVAQGSVGLLVGPKGECEAGKTYTYSAYVKGTSGASSGWVYLDWYTDGGRYISSTPWNEWSVTNGGVTRINTGPQKAPNRAMYGVIVIAQNSPVITATGLLYEEATTVGTYFDGDTSGATWTGANGNSVSTIG